MRKRNRVFAGLVGGVAAVVAVTMAAGPVQAGEQSSAVAQLSGKGGPPGYEIYFVRHAHSTYPEPEQELSELGLQEADALVAALHDVDVRSVDTSMMLRSFQTGDGVAVDHDLPVTADKRLNEIQLVPPAGVDPYEGYDIIMRDWLEGANRDVAYGDENYYDVKERWTGWWQSYVREHRADRGAGVVVAHGAIYMTMLPATCTNPIDVDFVMDNGFDNTGYLKAELLPNGDLKCSEWNGTPIPGVK